MCIRDSASTAGSVQSPARPSAIVTWPDASGADLARFTAAGLIASGRNGRVRVAFPDCRPAGSAPADSRDGLARLARFSGAAPSVPRAGPSNPSNPSIPSIPSDAAPVDPPRDDDALVLDKVVHESLDRAVAAARRFTEGTTA